MEDMTMAICATNTAPDGPKRFARWAFTCQACAQPGGPGDAIAWSRKPGDKGKSWHWTCRPGADTTRAPTAVDVDERTAPAPAPTPPGPPAPTGSLEALIAAAVAPLLAGQAPGVDEAVVRDLIAADRASDRAALTAYVDAAVSRLSLPTQVVVDHRPTGTTIDVGLCHAAFPHVLAAVQAGLAPLYLWGPPGTGKSTTAQQVATALGQERFAFASLNKQSSATLLIGYMDATGRPVRTPFRDCYEHGGVFSLEEMDNGNGNLLNTLNTLLENGHGAFPDAMVPRHAEFVLVANGNTPGLGADLHYPERGQLDSAFRERFTFVHWPIDDALEAACVAAEGAGAAGDTWLAWIRTVRAHAATAAPRLIVSPRASIRGARALAAGWSADAGALADAVLFKGFDPDRVTSILAACPLPVLV
jgi:hypothetical protein